MIVSGRFRNQRLAGVPMEANGIVAVPGEPAGGITLWVPTQSPHAVRDALAPAIGLEAPLVRVVAPAVGGGFGPKAAVYVEYMIAAKAALGLGPSGEVDGDALGEHGRDGAGARPGTGSRARPEARRHHRRLEG